MQYLFLCVLLFVFLFILQNGSRGEANHGEDKAASQMRCSSDESVKGKSMTIQVSVEVSFLSFPFGS